MNRNDPLERNGAGSLFPRRKEHRAGAGRAAVPFAAAALAFALATVVALASCASAPEAAAAPAWALQVPSPDATATYFVGYADGPADGLAQATDAATASLIAEIMRYIGVKVSSETTATARATLDEFQADLVQTVKQSGSGRMEGFRIADKYVSKKSDGGLTVYILGSFETRSLEAERARIAALFKEKTDAVARPEAEGQRLLSSGDPVGAARSFMAAALAAAGADIDNADVKFERNAAAAVAALSDVELLPQSWPRSSTLGSTYTEPFRALLRSSRGPVASAPVQVSYPTKLPNGRLSTKTATIMSAADGVVSFAPPDPNFVGPATLTMRLDLSSSLEPLLYLDRRFLPRVAAIEDAVAEKRTSFSYTVESAAKGIPLAVFIVDLDETGAVDPSAITAASVLSTLSKNGFSARTAKLGSGDVAGRDDASVLEAARSALGATVPRFVYGTSRVLSVSAEGDRKMAKVSAEIKVVDLASGAILYTASKQVSALGSNAALAVEAARRQLGGKTVGEDLIASLP